MPQCRDCGTEEVVWGQAKSGAWVLFDTEPILHLRTCKERRARIKKEKAEPAHQAEEILAEEPQFRWGRPEAQRLIKKVGPHGTVEEIIERAIKAKGEGE